MKVVTVENELSSLKDIADQPQANKSDVQKSVLKTDTVDSLTTGLAQMLASIQAQQAQAQSQQSANQILSQQMVQQLMQQLQQAPQAQTQPTMLVQQAAQPDYFN